MTPLSRSPGRPSRQLLKRFLHDTALLQSGQFAMIVVQALTNILLIRILGAELLGIYTIALALAGIVALLDVSGSGRVALMQLARAIGANNVAEIRDVLAYFVRINLQINVPLVILFFFAAPIASDALYHNPQIATLGRWLILIELTDIPTGLIGMVYQCRGDTRTLIAYETSKIVSVSLVTIVVLLIGGSLTTLVISILLVNVIFAAMSIIRYHRLAQIDPRFPSWSALLRDMPAVRLWPRFRLGFLIAMDKNLGSLVDKLVVLLFGTLGAVAVGELTIATKIITLPQPLISGIARNLDVFLPKQVGEDYSRLLHTYVLSTVYTGAIWSVITVGLAFGGPIALYVLFPKDVAALPLLYPLLFQSLSVGLGVGIGPALRTVGKIEYSMLVQFMVLVLIIPLGSLAITHFKVYGAAWVIGLEPFLETLIMAVIAYELLRSQPTLGAVKDRQP